MDSPKHARACRAGTRIRFECEEPDNTLRILKIEDEGIVQSAAKAAGELSPRLHQRSVPGNRAGNATSTTVMPNVVRTLTDAEAAYIAGIVDGEGSVARPRNGRYTAELLAARSAFESAFFEIRARVSAYGAAAGTSHRARSLSGNEHAR